MLINECRPALYCKDYICQNLSINGRVFFIEEGHKYYHEDDVTDDGLVPFEESKYAFRSPTGIIKDFYEEFDSVLQAKKYVKKHELKITWEQLVYAWEEISEMSSFDGTLLHGYGEALFNKWNMERPNHTKTIFVENLYKKLTSKYILAKTELLIYSTKLRLAGQVDLLMRNKDRSEYYILDYKFLKEPLEKKSYYNKFTRKYKMMTGPFSRLMDTDFYHYSIQMEIYRYLMGELGKKVKSKTLMVVTNEGYELVEGHPMRIWVDVSGTLHAKYRHYKNKLYDSSMDPEYLENPYKII